MNKLIVVVILKNCVVSFACIIREQKYFTKLNIIEINKKKY